MSSPEARQVISYEDAVAQLMGPGGMFEVDEADVFGQQLKVFKNCPPSLRALFDATRARYAEDADLAKAMATNPLGPAPEGADLADLAALTVAANVLLNLDEFLMKR